VGIVQLLQRNHTSLLIVHKYKDEVSLYLLQPWTICSNLDFLGILARCNFLC